MYLESVPTFARSDTSGITATKNSFHDVVTNASLSRKNEKHSEGYSNDQLQLISGQPLEGKKIKVLVFNGGKTNGHTSPAIAIQYALEEHPAFDVKFRNTNLGGSGNDSRCRRIKYAIKWHIRNTNRLWKVYTYPVTVKFFKKLVQAAETAVKEEKPDVIITTHHWSGQFLRDAVKKASSDAAVISVVTDFDRVHREWFDMKPCNNHVWALPSHDSVAYAKSRGLPAANTEVTGYPVRHEFSSDSNAKAMREKLSLPSDRTVTLVMAGSGGTSKAYNMVKAMMHSPKTADESWLPPHIVVIAGRNEKSKLDLEKLIPRHEDSEEKPSLQVLGFVSNISEYMIASDVILTKSGGSTLAEILQIGKPYILYDKLSPTEQGNINHTISHRTGIVALGGPKSATKQWEKLITNEELRSTMLRNQESTTIRNGAERVVDLAKKVASQSREIVA